VAISAPSTRWNPLRTYQFRIGLLEPPPDAAATGRTFLGVEQAGGGGRPPPAERYVAGVRRVSGLNLRIAAHEVWEGGNALHRYANPDRASWDAIVLEQGLAIDDTLERWASAAVAFLKTGMVDPREPVKRNLFLDVWDTGLHEPNGGATGDDPLADRLRRYLVFNAWISRLQAVPQLDAMTDEVALLLVELSNEGWRSEAPTGFGRPRASTPAGGTPEGG
jgi:phage tail-like protein